MCTKVNLVILPGKKCFGPTYMNLRLNYARLCSLIVILTDCKFDRCDLLVNLVGTDYRLIANKNFMAIEWRFDARITIYFIASLADVSQGGWKIFFNW